MADELPPLDQEKTIHEVIEYPARPERETTAEYRHNRHILIDRLGLGCRACGTRQKLQTHHIFEHAQYGKEDPERMLLTLRQIDFYGFGHHKGDQPLSGPDDIRNLLVLCEKHHIGSEGIHTTDGGAWLAYLGAKPGVVIVEHVDAAAK